MQAKLARVRGSYEARNCNYLFTSLHRQIAPSPARAYSAVDLSHKGERWNSSLLINPLALTPQPINQRFYRYIPLRQFALVH